MASIRHEAGAIQLSSSQDLVIQEVVSAKSIVIHCGDDTSTWEALIEARVNEYCLKKPSPVFHQSIIQVYTLDLIRTEYHLTPGSLTDPVDRGKNEDSILVLMEMFSHTACEDRRDKLYALLSLRPATFARLRPDYTISLIELFTRVCLEIFNHGDELRVVDRLLKTLALNLSEVVEVLDTFLDANASTSRRFRLEGRAEVLCAVTDQVFRLLDIADLDGAAREGVRAKAAEAQAFLEREGLSRAMSDEYIERHDLD